MGAPSASPPLYLAGCAAVLDPGSCLAQGYSRGGVGDRPLACLTVHAHLRKEAVSSRVFFLLHANLLREGNSHGLEKSPAVRRASYCRSLESFSPPRAEGASRRGPEEVPPHGWIDTAGLTYSDMFRSFFRPDERRIRSKRGVFSAFDQVFFFQGCDHLVAIGATMPGHPGWERWRPGRARWP